MSVLEQAKDFNGLKSLDKQQLDMLCSELREMICDVTLKNGGHLASSLGAVELIVALLRVFNPDEDKIMFDVGHQAYAYKILTKRKDRFKSLRNKGGLAGFPLMSESKYDFFTTGHSSTSISAALGYAKARDLRKETHNVISVIGDGALLNGVAFEGLNNVQPSKSKTIIILNDNRISINQRVGGFANCLAALSVNSTYKKIKNFIKRQCNNNESFVNKLTDAKTKLKSIVLPLNIFEQMGISYWGPFDGHDVKELEHIFNLAKQYDKSVLIHVLTQKGKGFDEVEQNPAFFHGIGPGSSLSSAATANLPDKKKSWSSAATDCIVEAASKDEKITACTAAMKDGTKLGKFAELFPERFFDTGIAEEHMVIFAAGLAAGGMKPVVCIYSTFLQRAADQIVHDVCLPNLPVLFCIDRAGLVGSDGQTHHGVLDIAWLRAVPNIVMVSPRDEIDLKFFVNYWFENNKFSMAIRYPRGEAKLRLCRENNSVAEWGKAEILNHGDTVALMGMGSTVELMLDSADEMKEKFNKTATVIDLRFAKPIDFKTLEPVLRSHKLIITAEEGNVSGGVGEAVAAYCCENNIAAKVCTLGVPDVFIPHASRSEQWQDCGLTAENIMKVYESNEG